MDITEIINLDKYQISNPSFKDESRRVFEKEGILILPNFISKKAIEAIRLEGINNQEKAYFCVERHNPYLMPTDPDLPDDHPRNKQVTSSKGCIADDQIPKNSPLKTLYGAQMLKDFLSFVLKEEALYPYADEVSPINLHYAKTGQELGWHYDNSSFAITLMIEPATKGGEFEYVRNVRDADNKHMNFAGTDDVISGKTTPNRLSLPAGALVMFRGRNAIHRVTPNLGDVTRMLVVLAYNSEPGIAISKTARRLFYGR